MSSWYVYIASSQAGKLYVGISTNVMRRINEHNSGKGAYFAKQNGELRLVYVSPRLENQSTARKREIQLKGWTRAKNLSSSLVDGNEACNRGVQKTARKL